MKQRVDILLAELGFFPTKDAAERAIMAGIVYNHSTQERITHAGMQLTPGSVTFEVKGKKHPYVSRGGLKLEGAISNYHLDFKNKVVLDIGASTGGFTDCALQNGASFVYALDVGTNQLAWKLRNSEQVMAMEQLNFRHATQEMFTKKIDVIVTDVSFISLKVILDQVDVLFGNQSFEMVALVKPQFEVAREEVGPNGIVRDDRLRARVLQEITSFVEDKGWHVIGTMQSPITGAKGNVEYLLVFEHQE